jgi:hypothetical protein
MQNKTELIYKIGRTAVVNPLEYRALYITVKAKEGPSDAIYFLWHYESQNRAEDNITEDEIEAGEMQRNGKTYKIDPELATELRQELKEQKNIEVLRS